MRGGGRCAHSSAPTIEGHHTPCSRWPLGAPLHAGGDGLQVSMAAAPKLLAVALLLLLAVGEASAGFYGASDDVVTLTPANFDKLVGRNDTVWLVELYAQW